MFWAAGQQRMERESRNRLTELYVGVRDGVQQSLLRTVAVTVDRLPDLTLPSYVQPDPVHRRVSAARGLAQLMRDFPSSVSRGPGETN